MRLQASRNHTLIKIIDAVLAANPHLKRDAEELAALDVRETVSSWERESKRPRLGARRGGSEEAEEEDGTGGLAALFFRAALGSIDVEEEQFSVPAESTAERRRCYGEQPPGIHCSFILQGRTGTN